MKKLFGIYTLSGKMGENSIEKTSPHDEKAAMYSEVFGGELQKEKRRLDEFVSRATLCGLGARTMRKRMLVVGVALLSLGMACGAISCGGNTSSEPTQSSIKEQPKEGKRVYFAAPLFSQAERDYNAELTAILERYEYTVFLPQRDGFLAVELEGLSPEEKTKKIFEKDCQELLASDIWFGVLDGRVPDEGVCVELGLAYSAHKRCYGFKTDSRSVEMDLDLNPMIVGCLDKLFYSTNGQEAVKQLTDYLDHNEL